MNDPLGIKPNEFTSDNYIKLIKLWNLDDTQLCMLRLMIDDVYIDGWTDGNASIGGLSPREYKERISNDIANSWSRLISEGINE